MLLDDGFQHVKLARNFDLVLMDALNPFGGGEVFPVGRLREPVQGLARADAIVITRSEASDLVPAIERAVRRWNPQAPDFPRAHRARVVGGASHRPHDSARRNCSRSRGRVLRAWAIRRGFYRTLEAWACGIVDCVEFEDHHRYLPNELGACRAVPRKGATALVTTEKDAVNLCEGCDDLLAPLPLYWLKIGMRIEGEAELLQEIERRIG